MSTPVVVSVRILDKDYQVAAPPDERAGLLDSAKLLNDRMTEVRNSGAVAGLDRIAVISSLNLTHELLQAQASQANSENSGGERINRLCRKIETVLAKTSQLELP